MEVEFFSEISTKRPIRLCDKTRQFAYDSLSGKYGRELKLNPILTADDIEGFDNLSDIKKQDIFISKIANEAPLRICERELICGSATLFQAIQHVIPVKYKDNFMFGSVSHLTCGFDKVLDIGLNEYKRQIDLRLKDNLTKDEREFMESLDNVYTSIKIWHSRYLNLLIQLITDSSKDEDKDYYSTLYNNLKKVPFEKPSSFREAVQSLYFTFAFVRLCGNWPGIGRLDQMLGNYLKNDLESNKITMEEAREILAHFFIKGCEWITSESNGSGDAQHYQNIVIGGIDVSGKEITHVVTHLVLDIIEELSISDFPIAIRINSNTSAHLYKRIAEVVRHGGGIVAVYNEELILNSLLEYGYSVEEARRFANDGCWEVQVPGKTSFTYAPFDGFGMFQRDVLKLNSNNPVDFTCYEDLYQAYLIELNRHIENFHKTYDLYCTSNIPCSVVSLLTDDCIGNARCYYNRGARYSVASPHMGGIPDLANSLYAIKKLVFDEKKVSFPHLVEILRNNWEGYDALRLYVRNSYTYFGNDSDEVDEIATQIMSDYTKAVRQIKNRNGVLRPAGVSTFGRQIEWRNNHMATAHGFKNGEILSGNFSPTPGTDKSGATAIILSHCKSDLSKLTCGTALDILLYPTTVNGEEGISAITSLIKGFISLGGFFMQMDVIDTLTLLEAQKNPEKYQNLAVRISGWSARFVTLNKEWQEMIIRRNSQ